MVEATNVLLFVADALIYFAVLATLFRFRHRLGLGAFFCALGVLHFIETYLASNLYVALPLGVVASPGSVVLFSGKLVLLLIVYIREDATVVRQPIYGLLFGNLLTLAMAALLVHHVPLALDPGRLPDLGFLHQMGGLMVWGTALLFIDSILIILLYEHSRRWLGQHIFLRVWLCAAAVLTFDQIGFSVALNVLFGVNPVVLVGGWAAKMGAALLYAGLATVYLRRFDRAETKAPRLLGDVFETLTFRERYEDLLERSSRDTLTGVNARSRLQETGPDRVAAAVEAGQDLTLFMIDVDHFKEFNDRLGHAAGDAMLRQIAQRLVASVRSSDLVCRFGGEEFVVICPGLGMSAAGVLGELLREVIAGADEANPTIARSEGGAPASVTASIGYAVCTRDGTDYDTLFAVADRRMYEAKAAGRNRVIGPPPPASRPQLAYSA